MRPRLPTTLMLKPVGAGCNLRCSYCYYRGDRDPGQQMSLELVEAIFTGALPDAGDVVNVCWQGGEPTLAGLDFYEHVLEVQGRFTRPGQRLHHALMTNATLLDDDWCRFLARTGFLVGVSVDGQKLVHDRYRVNAAGQGSYAEVARGIRLLRKYRVPYNLLAVVTDANVGAPQATWDHLMALGGEWLQLIPAIEWRADETVGSRGLAPFVVEPAGYGRFLADLFDLWESRKRRRVTVRLFDSALATLVLGSATVCTQARRCNDQLTIEADGSVYACDHFAIDAWRLGRVEVGTAAAGPTWVDQLDWHRFAEFADRKAALSAACERCDHLRFCFGGCPKHRGTPDAPTVLCEATKYWLRHALPRLEELADELRRGVRRPLRRAPARAS